MSPENWGGIWIIFPLIMIPTMLTFMYLMFVRGRGGPPWQGSDMGHRQPERYREPLEQRGTETSESPLDILSRRYASGEITKAEFDQMKQDLA